MSIKPLSDVLTGGGLNQVAPMARANQMLGQQANTVNGPEAFSNILTNAINGVHQAQTTSKSMQRSYLMGDPNSSLEGTMLAMNQASLSFQMLAQTRNKVVAAYSEVMNMPI